MGNKTYLTIHGHFYQPPRENPWLEAIELQDSAKPMHDWNERVCKECYNPNSVSKIVDNRNKILDVVNNYEYINFNFGPTLLSWMEKFAPHTYDRIIKADIKSVLEHDGHGNAIAQVYNHMIMPLANENDKQTQVKWGIQDFIYRFGRHPEGMWLAEAAVDDDTLRVLAENNIKFTILSPFQAARVKPIKDSNWQDVSWGNIDPARSYRYYIKSAPGKYIDLFFYDGAISQSVAFDELLTDGNKFVKRLKEGISYSRNYNQLVNIATDGESYGHHTKFGDMALAYAVKVKAKDEGFILTNYSEYLAKNQPDWEVEIKPASSWSCSHGVGRWKEDCGCSTGAQVGWNQKWRKPLREALDYIRDEMSVLFETEGKKYFAYNPWDVRNKYISVILDRSERVIKNFQKENFLPDLSYENKVNGMKLLEIVRQTMLMYTSCGWFFSEISGIETIQIMKYAARAIQLASDFTDKDFETKFLDILSNAQSNIKEYGNSKDIYNRFVKPSIVTTRQIASLWAISSLYQDFDDEEDIYCYKIKKLSYKKVQQSNTNFVIGHIEVLSKVTLEKSDLAFVLLQYQEGDFHCAIKNFTNEEDFIKLQKELVRNFMLNPLTETIRAIDDNFGKEYFTLKDIFIEERRKILEIMLKDKMDKLAATYEEIYNEGKAPIYHMQSLGLSVPDEFKLAAGYTLAREFNNLMNGSKGFVDEEIIQHAADINFEAKQLGIEIDKTQTSKMFSKKLLQNIIRIANSIEIHQAAATLEIFDFIEKLDLKVEISEAQNLFFTKVFHTLGILIDNYSESKSNADKKLVSMLLEIGKKLNINIDFYKNKFDKVVLNNM